MGNTTDRTTSLLMAGRPRNGEVCPSNRKANCPVTGHRAAGGLPFGAGVDRLSVSFSIREYEECQTAWRSVAVLHPGPEEVEQFAGEVEVRPGVRAFVGVRTVPATKETWAKVEFNPSRVHDPEGARLASVSEAMGAYLLAWDAARELVTPMSDNPLVGNVKRLDVARDFSGVSDPGLYLRALLPIHRPYARRQFAYNDPGRNMAETVYVGSGAGGVRLYDKHREQPEKVVEGTLRWETEARDRWLSRLAAIETLEDLTEERVTILARDRWEWSAMGTAVESTAAVVQKVKSTGLSPRKRAMFIGWLVNAAYGEQTVTSRTTLTEFRQLARDLGVALDGGALSGAPEFVGRLDFDSGREVLQVA